MWDDFAEFILTQATENPTRIVEIAVGKFDGVYQYLKRNENIEIIKTDILPNDDEVIKMTLQILTWNYMKMPILYIPFAHQVNCNPI